MVKHIFLARWSNRATPTFEIDALISIDWTQETGYPEPIEEEFVEDSDKRITGLTDEQYEQIQGLLFRSQFQGGLIPGGPFVVNAETEMSRDELESYFEHLPDAERERKLKDAAFGAI